jgi:hypothetical protein
MLAMLLLLLLPLLLMHRYLAISLHSYGCGCVMPVHKLAGFVTISSRRRR